MLVLFGVMATVMMVAVACGGVAEPSAPAPSSSVKSNKDVQLPADFQVAIYLGEEVVGGQEVKFSELFGQGKPVVFNMWAGLCPPCRLEMPHFQAVYDEYKDRVVLFGLDVGPFTNLGSSEDGRALVQQLGITYPTGTTSDAEVLRAYELIGMPTTYFIKPDGEIHQKWTGILTKDKLAELMEDLLEASKS